MSFYQIFKNGEEVGLKDIPSLIDELVNVIAEKDREIEMVLSIQDNQAVIIEKLQTDLDYVLTNAIHFAKIINEVLMNYGHTGMETDAFLAHSFVQSYLKRKKDQAG